MFNIISMIEKRCSNTLRYENISGQVRSSFCVTKVSFEFKKKNDKFESIESNVDMKEQVCNNVH